MTEHVHEGGGRWVGSNKLVELKKKKKKRSQLKMRIRAVFGFPGGSHSKESPAVQ